MPHSFRLPLMELRVPLPIRRPVAHALRTFLVISQASGYTLQAAGLNAHTLEACGLWPEANTS